MIYIIIISVSLCFWMLFATILCIYKCGVHVFYVYSIIIIRLYFLMGPNNINFIFMLCFYPLLLIFNAKWIFSSWVCVFLPAFETVVCLLLIEINIDEKHKIHRGCIFIPYTCHLEKYFSNISILRRYLIQFTNDT